MRPREIPYHVHFHVIKGGGAADKSSIHCLASLQRDVLYCLTKNAVAVCSYSTGESAVAAAAVSS